MLLCVAMQFVLYLLGFYIYVCYQIVNFHRDRQNWNWKNPKSVFFLLGLKYTLRTCLESKAFSLDSCHEPIKFVISFQKLLATFVFQFLQVLILPFSVKIGHLNFLYFKQNLSKKPQKHCFAGGILI